MKKSFCFILNPLEVTGDLPVELIPNHFLQRADAEQIEIIREKINRHYAHNFLLPAYEYDWMEEEKDANGGSSRKTQELPSENGVIGLLRLMVQTDKHKIYSWQLIFSTKI